MRGFPTPDYDADVRRAYKGGFTYLRPAFKEIDIEEGIVMDVNSLYPWAMYYCKLPYGDPIYFEGKYEHDKVYDLYIQHFTCQFRLKEGHIPTLQIKNNFSFIPTEYVTTSECEGEDGEMLDEPVELWLSSVDLELFMEHYEVLNPMWINGWKFKSTDKLFKEYIDKWMAIKIESTKNGNKSMRTLAKLMLNALYGKFALKPNVKSKHPYYDEGQIRYTTDKEWDTRKPLYIPVGVFVTAWARYKTITSAQKMYDYFVYADTDSLHLKIQLPDAMRNMSAKELEKLTTSDLQAMGMPIPDDFEIDPVALGAWKLESKFNRARFIRQKSYIEDWNKAETWDALSINSDEIKEVCEDLGLDFSEVMRNYDGYYDKALLNITCAGMPPRCYEHVTWDNFHEGSSYKGKLLPRHVKGGIVLQEIEFTILRS